MKRMFTPEFRNRLDAIIQFRSLDPVIIAGVVDKFLVELQAQLDDKHVVIEVDELARKWLAERGYDKQMGARPMARLIQENLKKPLAEKILFGELANGGGHVDITVENNVIVLHVEEVEKNAATPA